MTALILLVLCILALAYFVTRKQTGMPSRPSADIVLTPARGTPEYQAYARSLREVSAPAKGTPGYRTYMRDMRKA